MRKYLVCCLLAAASLSSAAQAAMVVQNWKITGSGFSYVGGGDDTLLPVEPAAFDVTVTFDNAFDVEPTSEGLIVHSSNLPGPMQFAYRADPERSDVRRGDQIVGLPLQNADHMVRAGRGW